MLWSSGMSLSLSVSLSHTHHPQPLLPVDPPALCVSSGRTWFMSSSRCDSHRPGGWPSAASRPSLPLQLTTAWSLVLGSPYPHTQPKCPALRVQSRSVSQEEGRKTHLGPSSDPIALGKLQA